ncbi:hypothetical protein BD310DRAFT_919916 [Dichomitus squalens]|uniref:Uncharacterized protein n=1 Tax=Dichomitus squalens TaxID=114155 RepID=A0A4Q9Q443_9APHY|nr:hypothetical protein BD310DRAFT_919916 [Dichomitus squalens]
MRSFPFHQRAIWAFPAVLKDHVTARPSQFNIAPVVGLMWRCSRADDVGSNSVGPTGQANAQTLLYFANRLRCCDVRNQTYLLRIPLPSHYVEEVQKPGWPACFRVI